MNPKSVRFIEWALQKFRYLKTVGYEISSFAVFIALERGFMARGPVFLVGCGHSGTSATLMLLSKALQLHALEEESRLFLFRRSGILHEFLSLMSRGAFSKLRDASRGARAQGGVWVEKTPGHVHFIDRIRFWIPNARFIGIWRDPLDVVPSLMGRGMSLDKAIQRWTQDNTCIVQMAKTGQPVHILRFESLIESPDQTLRKINSYLGLAGENGVPTPKLQAPPEGIASRANHAARRRLQMASGLFDSRGASAETLTKAITDRIRNQTAPILAELSALSRAD